MWHRPACLSSSLGGVSEAHSNDVIFAEYLLDGSHYGRLGLLLGEVVDN